jgi:osmotically-inducible protein OsmY
MWLMNSPFGLDRGRTQENVAMRLDSDVKHDVETELMWNPEIDSTDIAAKVTEGAVTLYGFARNLHEKHEAELSVKRITGVAAVANDLAIRPNPAERVSDPEIAREAVKALKGELPHAWEKIRPMVRDGRVVLEGVVNWQYVRTRAEQALHRVPGVLDIRNSITVQPAILDGEIESAIEAAFERSAVVDPHHVIVDVVGSVATLNGTVHSWVERDEANRAAWSAPGVTDVFDALTVRR